MDCLQVSSNDFDTSLEALTKALTGVKVLNKFNREITPSHESAKGIALSRFRMNEGQPMHLDRKGNPSKLFAEIMDIVDNSYIDATALISELHTPNFNDWYGRFEEEPSYTRKGNEIIIKHRTGVIENNGATFVLAPHMQEKSLLDNNGKFAKGRDKYQSVALPVPTRDAQTQAQADRTIARLLNVDKLSDGAVLNNSFINNIIANSNTTNSSLLNILKPFFNTGSIKGWERTKGLTVRIEEHPEKDSTLDKGLVVEGQYSKRNHSITLYTSSLNGISTTEVANELARVLTHEVIHSFTASTIALAQRGLYSITIAMAEESEAGKRHTARFNELTLKQQKEELTKEEVNEYKVLQLATKNSKDKTSVRVAKAKERYYAAINSLYASAKRNKPDHIAYSSLSEFAAYGITDAGIMEDLSNMKSARDKETGLFAKFVKLVSELFDSILSTFNNKYSIEGSKLEDLLTTTLTFANHQTPTHRRLTKESLKKIQTQRLSSHDSLSREAKLNALKTFYGNITRDLEGLRNEILDAKLAESVRGANPNANDKKINSLIKQEIDNFVKGKVIGELNTYSHALTKEIESKQKVKAISLKKGRFSKQKLEILDGEILRVESYKSFVDNIVLELNNTNTLWSMFMNHMTINNEDIIKLNTKLDNEALNGNEYDSLLSMLIDKTNSRSIKESTLNVVAETLKGLSKHHFNIMTNSTEQVINPFTGLNELINVNDTLMDLYSSLANITSMEHMMDKLHERIEINPSLAALEQILIDDANLRSAFYANFNKALLPTSYQLYQRITVQDEDGKSHTRLKMSTYNSIKSFNEKKRFEILNRQLIGLDNNLYNFDKVSEIIKELIADNSTRIMNINNPTKSKKLSAKQINTKIGKLDEVFNHLDVNIPRQAIEVVMNNYYRDKAGNYENVGIILSKVKDMIETMSSDSSPVIEAGEINKSSQRHLINNLRDIVGHFDSYIFDVIEHSYLNTEGNVENDLLHASFLTDWISKAHAGNKDTVEYIDELMQTAWFNNSNWFITVSDTYNNIDKSDEAEVTRVKELIVKQMKKLILHKDGGIKYEVTKKGIKPASIDNVEFLNTQIYKYMSHLHRTSKNSLVENDEGEYRMDYTHFGYTSILPIMQLSDAPAQYSIEHTVFPVRAKKKKGVNVGHAIRRSDSIFRAYSRAVMQERSRMKATLELMMQADDKGNYITDDKGNYVIQEQYLNSDGSFNVDGLVPNRDYKLVKQEDGSKKPMIYTMDDRGFMNMEGNVFTYYSIPSLNEETSLFNNGAINLVNKANSSDIIMNHIEQFFDTTLKDAGNLNLMLSNELLTDLKESNEAIADRLITLEYLLNSHLSYIEQQNFIFGTESEFPYMLDTTKRAKGPSSSGLGLALIGGKKQYKLAVGNEIQAKSLSEEFMQQLDDKIENKKHFKIIKDFYNGSLTDIADAQGWATVQRYGEIMRSQGLFDKISSIMYAELVDGAYVYSMKEGIAVNDIVNALQVLKPFLYDRVYNKATNDFHSVMVKYSLVPLIPELVQGTVLADMTKAMEEQGIDEFIMPTAMKLGQTVVNDIFNGSEVNEKGFDNLKVINLNNSAYRIQLEVPDHIRDTENKAGIQLMKLILTNLHPDIKYYDGLNGKEVFDKFNESVVKLINITGEEVSKDLDNGDYKTLLERLKQGATDLNLSPNQMRYLEDVVPSITGVKTKVPVTFSANYSKNQSILTGIPRNNITNLKLPGLHAVLLSNAMTGNSMQFEEAKGSTELKEYFNDEGELVYEILLPYWTKDLVVNGNVVDINQLTDAAKMLSGYRIPTSGKHSAMRLEVKGFLDEKLGSTVMLPDSVIDKTGSDFDIDSFYVNTFNLIQRNEEGRVKIDVLKESDRTEDDALFDKKITQNEVAYILAKVLSSPALVDEVMSPAYFESLKQDSEDIRSILDSKTNYSAANPFQQLAFRNDANNGKRVLAAGANTNIGLATLQGLKAAFSYTGNLVSIPYSKATIVELYGKDWKAKLERKYGKDNVKVISKVVAPTDTAVIITSKTIGYTHNNSFTNVYGDNILESFAQIIDQAADAVKAPLVPNLTIESFGVWSGLAYSGDTKFANYMMGQEVMAMTLESMQESKRLIEQGNGINVFGQTKIKLMNRVFKDLTVDEYTRLLKAKGVKPEDKSAEDMLKVYEAVKKKVANSYYKSITTKQFAELGLDKVYEASDDFTMNTEQLRANIVNYANYSELSTSKKFKYDKNQFIILNRLKDAEQIGKDLRSVIDTLNFDKKGLGATIDENNSILDNIVEYSNNSTKAITTRGGSDLMQAVYPNFFKHYVNGYDIDLTKGKVEQTLTSSYPLLETYLIEGVMRYKELYKDFLPYSRDNRMYAEIFDTVSKMYGTPVNEYGALSNQIVSVINNFAIRFNSPKDALNLSKGDEHRLLGINKVFNFDKSLEFSKFRELSVGQQLEYVKKTNSNIINDSNLLYYLIPETDANRVAMRGYHHINFTLVSKNELQEQVLQESFMSMFQSEDLYIRELMINLVKHNFITVNFSNAYNSFNRIIPYDVLIGETFEIQHGLYQVEDMFKEDGSVHMNAGILKNYVSQQLSENAAILPDAPSLAIGEEYMLNATKSNGSNRFSHRIMRSEVVKVEDADGKYMFYRTTEVNRRYIGPDKDGIGDPTLYVDDERGNPHLLLQRLDVSNTTASLNKHNDVQLANIKEAMTLKQEVIISPKPVDMARINDILKSEKISTNNISNKC